MEMQIENSLKMEKLRPMQRVILDKFSHDDVTKFQLLHKLFHAAEINPFSSTIASLAQFPLFLVYYRTLQNLVYSGKLREPFLWLPSLEGPSTTSSSSSQSPTISMEWLTSVFTGKPLLGWTATLSYLSIPLLIYISQSMAYTMSLSPHDDLNTAQNGTFSNHNMQQTWIPLMTALLSLKLPAGIGN